MRKLPKPFQRPSIDLGSVRREWLTVDVSKIDVGDIVPDLGRITEINTNLDRLILHGLNGDRSYNLTDSIYAFVKVTE